MRYEVGRFRRPMRRSTEGQLVGLVDLGDGSTLSLDFTAMSGLDSRFTFSRASTATFINSSGLVQFANENRIPSSTWATTSPPSGWNTATTSGNGTFTWNGNGSITASTGASGEAYSTLSASTATSIGLFYTVTVTVLSVTGSPTIESTLNMTNVTGRVWYKNGAVATASTTFAANDVIGVSGTASGAINIRIGAGAWFAARNNESVTLTRPHMHSGVTPNQPYYANTTGGVFYDSARFDHDPATLQPKGLLIENSATNLTAYSDGVNQSPWTVVCNVVRTTSTGGTAPDGTSNTASRIGMTSTITNCSALYYNGVTVTNQAYTHSVFVKADGADWVYVWIETSGSVAYGAYFNLTGNGSVGNLVGIGTTARIEKFPNGWYRCQTTSTQPAGTTYPCVLPSTGNLTGRSSMVGTTPGNILVWGAQLEAGSGASSYIPTGSGTVQRAADLCTMPTASFITGTLYPHTLYIDVIPSTPSGGYLDIVRLFDRTVGGTFAYGTELYYYSAATMTAQRKLNASTTTDRTFLSGLAYNARHKLAVSVDSSAFLGSYNGNTALGATTAPSALASVVTHMGIGCSGDSPGSAVMFGAISRIKFFPRSMSQAELNGLTQ